MEDLNTEAEVEVEAEEEEDSAAEGTVVVREKKCV